MLAAGRRSHRNPGTLWPEVLLTRRREAGQGWVRLRRSAHQLALTLRLRLDLYRLLKGSEDVHEDTLGFGLGATSDHHKLLRPDLRHSWSPSWAVGFQDVFARQVYDTCGYIAARFVTVGDITFRDD